MDGLDYRAFRFVRLSDAMAFRKRAMPRKVKVHQAEMAALRAVYYGSKSNAHRDTDGASRQGQAACHEERHVHAT